MSVLGMLNHNFVTFSKSFPATITHGNIADFKAHLVGILSRLRLLRRI